MTQFDQALKTGRRMARNARTAAGTALDGGEMMRASGDVIAARMDIMARGLADPMRADLKELALMGTEKVEALSASAAVAGRALSDVMTTIGRDAAAEAETASRALAAMSSASSPAAAAAIQMTWALGWWSRAAGQALAANTRLLKAQADALAPLHRAAVDNAKRLKR
jgi:hypothetical protein